jgi:hypothetical protein
LLAVHPTKTIELQLPRKKLLCQIDGLVVRAAMADEAIDWIPVDSTQLGQRLLRLLRLCGPLSGRDHEAPVRGLKMSWGVTPTSLPVITVHVHLPDLPHEHDV